MTNSLCVSYASFAFDGDGARELQVRPDGSRTAYVGGLLEIDIPAPSALTYRESSGQVADEYIRGG